ncbi:hypothetical protein B0187_03855 [Haemophilus paracuniculus]|uniref:Integral membrane protein n=1 Tax=Haemophilus paracuniculus TaxID=734 RepID=A0A1T0ATQ6_9PAST|nr:DUF2301 domain-containing membrane protein [Haemophilus paracuniculus]OOR99951.1 hypothetical protein B0187_03855 [Haemophilus paracuniculus]
MADPHIQSPLDVWDKLTVICYRSGFVVATLMLALLPYFPNLAQLGLLIAGTMLASSLHIYLKPIRFTFQFAMWIGLLCQIFGVPTLALGAALLVIGGLCYKEYFCFRIFGLAAQPILLALLWLATVAEIPLAQIILSTIASLLLLILSIQKWRMPLHFDIGDKGKYQV